MPQGEASQLATSEYSTAVLDGVNFGFSKRRLLELLLAVEPLAQVFQFASVLTVVGDGHHRTARVQLHLCNVGKFLIGHLRHLFTGSIPDGRDRLGHVGSLTGTRL
jgi:hypothetical protein